MAHLAVVNGFWLRMNDGVWKHEVYVWKVCNNLCGVTVCCLESEKETREHIGHEVINDLRRPDTEIIDFADVWVHEARHRPCSWSGCKFPGIVVGRG